MRVTLRLGRQFAREAGLEERVFDLPGGASTADLLSAVARALPSLSCVEGGTVDLAVASLSVNGAPVDPRSPSAARLAEGDACYLFGPVAGG